MVINSTPIVQQKRKPLAGYGPYVCGGIVSIGSNFSTIHKPCRLCLLQPKTMPRKNARQLYRGCVVFLCAVEYGWALRVDTATAELLNVLNVSRRHRHPPTDRLHSELSLEKLTRK